MFETLILGLFIIVGLDIFALFYIFMSGWLDD